jgi:hypothetical protein
MKLVIILLPELPEYRLSRFAIRTVCYRRRYLDTARQANTRKLEYTFRQGFRRRHSRATSVSITLYTTHISQTIYCLLSPQYTVCYRLHAWRFRNTLDGAIIATSFHCWSRRHAATPRRSTLLRRRHHIVSEDCAAVIFTRSASRRDRATPAHAAIVTSYCMPTTLLLFHATPIPLSLPTPSVSCRLLSSF